MLGGRRGELQTGALGEALTPVFATVTGRFCLLLYQACDLSKMGGGSKDCSVSGTLQSTLLLHIHPGKMKSFVHRATQVQIFPTVLLMMASN